MMKLIAPILLLSLFSTILSSCCHVEEEENPQETIPEITILGGRGTFIKEALFKELDTSIWVLHNYQIKRGSLPVKRYNVNSSDEYKFPPSLNAVIKNELRIGKIQWEDTHIPANVKNINGELVGKRFYFRIHVDQFNEPLMNGEFRVVYGKWKRLHLEQRRINNRTNEIEYRRLIFYKKS